MSFNLKFTTKLKVLSISFHFVILNLKMPLVTAIIIVIFLLFSLIFKYGTSVVLRSSGFLQSAFYSIPNYLAGCFVTPRAIVILKNGFSSSILNISMYIFFKHISHYQLEYRPEVKPSVEHLFAVQRVTNRLCAPNHG